MREPVRQRLLELNRDFYAQVADPFDATRQRATPGLSAILPYFRPAGKGMAIPETGRDARPTVLDVGCGNGLFARLLDAQGIVCDYTGVDGNADLLHRAEAASADLTTVHCRFVQADLSDPTWSAGLDGERFSRLLCTATIQHLPGYDLRRQVVRDLARLCTGAIVLSFWQFLTSERFRARRIDWSVLGLDESDVDPGDALLPWKQGVEATRYVHQVDESELGRLAADAGLSVVNTFRADGKEGNLNLYALLQPIN